MVFQRSNWLPRLQSSRTWVRFGAATGIAACALLLSWTLASSTTAAVALFAVAALAAVRPIDALSLVIALSPVVTYAARTLFGLPGDWAEALVLALLAGTCARRLWRPEPDGRGALQPWSLVFGATVIASAIVQLATDRAVLTPASFDAQLAELLRHYGISLNGVAKTVHDSARLVEGLGLLALAAGVAGTEAVRLRLLRLLVIGAAANAVLNIERIVSGALRRNALEEVPALLRVVRLSLPHGDVNAAGSHFALALLVGFGLLLAARRRGERVVASLALGACAAGLWITGSRAGIVALVVMVLTWVAWRAGRRSPVRILVPSIAAALLMLWLFPNPVFSRSATGSLSIRYEMARSGFRMWQASPLFGAGIGQFFERSSEFIRDDYVRTLYGRENAHNNFIQIGAELGLAGLIGFFGVLVAAALRTRAGLSAAGPHPELIGAACGIGAFLITCTGGHPLLLTEVSIAFWFTLGVVCAAAPPAPAPPRGRAAAWAVIVLLAVSLPLRASRAIANANYEHVTYGLGSWQAGPDGVRFREMSGDVTLFVPNWAIVVEVPYRLKAVGAPATIRVEFRNRLAAVLSVDSDQWRTYRLVPPPASDGVNYAPLRFTVVQGAPESVVLGSVVMRARETGSPAGR